MTWDNVWECHIKDYLLVLEQRIVGSKNKNGKIQNLLVKARLGFILEHETLAQ